MVAVAEAVLATVAAAQEEEEKVGNQGTDTSGPRATC